MEKKLKYLGKAEGRNLHPDYVGTESYLCEFENSFITITIKNGKVWQFGYPRDRDKIGIIEKFEASKDYQEIIRFFEQKKAEAWKQAQIRANEVKLQRMRNQLGIKSKMVVIHCSTKPTEATFNLRDMNKNL